MNLNLDHVTVISLLKVADKSHLFLRRGRVLSSAFGREVILS